ncbi:unnamed protein product [Amoebophrya sp. A120]|nr:unnamed protein product [Amoebophrya sp. A120]|eukprot:GSA120T00009000001.1
MISSSATSLQLNMRNIFQRQPSLVPPVEVVHHTVPALCPLTTSRSCCFCTKCVRGEKIPRPPRIYSSGSSSSSGVSLSSSCTPFFNRSANTKRARSLYFSTTSVVPGGPAPAFADHGGQVAAASVLSSDHPLPGDYPGCSSRKQTRTVAAPVAPPVVPLFTHKNRISQYLSRLHHDGGTHTFATEDLYAGNDDHDDQEARGTRYGRACSQEPHDAEQQKPAMKLPAPEGGRMEVNIGENDVKVLEQGREIFDGDSVVVVPAHTTTRAVERTQRTDHELQQQQELPQRPREPPWIEPMFDNNKSRKSATMFELDSGEDLERQMYVHLVRHRDGRHRTPVLTIRSGKNGRSLLHLRKEELLALKDVILKFRQDGLKKTFQAFRKD